MSEVKWISRERWQSLLEQSRTLLAAAEHARRNENANLAASIWQDLAPINRVIRSPLIKVRGIDDKHHGKGCRYTALKATP